MSDFLSQFLPKDQKEPVKQFRPLILDLTTENIEQKEEVIKKVEDKIVVPKKSLINPILAEIARKSTEERENVRRNRK